jgi:hypothetical protein
MASRAAVEQNNRPVQPELPLQELAAKDDGPQAAPRPRFLENSTTSVSFRAATFITFAVIADRDDAGIGSSYEPLLG